MRERRVSDDLADAFVSEGVDTLFGLFGDGNLTFMQAMIDRPGVRVIHSRHEAAAVFMASGYSRATGRPGLASVTAGPGLAHTLTPLVSACRARLPLILYAGDTPHDGSYVGGLQDFDHAAFAAAAGALHVRADRDASVEACVAEAVRKAVERQLPVLFSVDEDYMEAVSADRRATNGGSGAALAARPVWISELAGEEPAVPADRAARRIADALRTATLPLFVVGSGAVAAGMLPQMRRLARRHGAMLATTFRAKGCLDDDPSAVGIIGPLAHASHQLSQEKADLVVGFGANLHGFGAFVDSLFDCSVLCLGTERHGGITGAHTGDCRIDASLPAVVDLLCEESGNESSPDRTPRVDSKSEAIASDFRELPEVHDPDLLDPRRFVIQLDDLLPDDCVVVIGGGHFWSSPLLYLSKRRRDFIFPLEFGSIGMALPTGIGVAASGGSREVVVIEGDGGVVSAIQEIETATRHRLPLTVVVMNDGALGAEYHKLVARVLPPEESAYEYVRFDEVARAFGARGVAVRSVAEIEPAYRRSAETSPTTVIDARISKLVTSRWYRRLYLKTV